MILFFKELRILDAMQVTLSNHLITFFGLLIAVICFGEKLNTSVVTNGILALITALIIAGVDYRINKTETKKV
jgi:drug/metabolite transporter (DMT)-like permease